MKDKIDKINIEYLCILKHKYNSKDIFIDFEKINNPHLSKIEEIKRLCENKSSQLKDIAKYLSNINDINDLNGYHHYCIRLDASFEGFTVNIQETINSIAEKQHELDKKKTEDEDFDYENAMEKFKEGLKNKITLWYNSNSLKLAYKKLEQDKSVIIYSHRIPGWTKPAYQIHPDFSFQLKSNFGYGTVSYFYTKLTFKGLEIVPFTDWINYSNARIFEIISYSSNHHLNNEKWHEAINFVLNAYNLFLESELKFIKK